MTEYSVFAEQLLISNVDPAPIRRNTDGRNFAMWGYDEWLLATRGPYDLSVQPLKPPSVRASGYAHWPYVRVERLC